MGKRRFSNRDHGKHKETKEIKATKEVKEIKGKIGYYEEEKCTFNYDSYPYATKAYEYPEKTEKYMEYEPCLAEHEEQSTYENPYADHHDEEYIEEKEIYDDEIGCAEEGEYESPEKYADEPPEECVAELQEECTECAAPDNYEMWHEAVEPCAPCWQCYQMPYPCWPFGEIPEQPPCQVEAPVVPCQPAEEMPEEECEIIEEAPVHVEKEKEIEFQFQYETVKEVPEVKPPKPKPKPKEAPYTVQKVEVKKPCTICGPMEETTEVYPPEEMEVEMYQPPIGMVQEGVEEAGEVTLPQAPACAGKLYTVQGGDTMFFIAKRHGISLQDLIDANPQIANPNMIMPGEVICIPAEAHQAPPVPATTECAGQLYTVRPGDTMYLIAQRHGISLQDLIAANPQIANPNMIMPGEVICIPAGAHQAPTQTTPETGGCNGRLYTVQPGDTMFMIAKRNRISLHSLIAANPQISNPDMIMPGQVICIPPDPREEGGERQIPPCSGQYYRVRRGDTLAIIGSRFNVSAQAILRANPQLKSSVLVPGQTICIPRVQMPPASCTGQLYTIRPGDTLAGIAARFGVTTRELLAANPEIINPNLLGPGEVICIPLKPTADRLCRLSLRPTDRAPGAFGTAVVRMRAGQVSIDAFQLPDPRTFGRFSTYRAWLIDDQTGKNFRVELRRAEGIWVGRRDINTSLESFDRIIITAEPSSSGSNPSNAVVLRASLAPCKQA